MTLRPVLNALLLSGILLGSGRLNAVPIEEPVTGGSLRDQIVAHMSDAKSSIDVVVYEIGSQDIADALADAKDRGVRVRIILDEERTIGYTNPERFLQDKSIPMKRVRVAQWKMMHDKFIIFDGVIATTPSYNQTDREDMKTGNPQPFSQDKTLIRQLTSEFNNVWNHSPAAE
jgi:hypothetical protein